MGIKIESLKGSIRLWFGTACFRMQLAELKPYGFS